ncbi:rRNA maturation RNase YbeY [Geosporobacter ferrireducens]|uniref:Endoribonuclease YbeY n=1 Tax=Geosporobacter ferrireducens TaxID=1424294 RepID=A0A1D8GC83_9FIRM|nr:rRNA maturation RNase YbeY [Geosporobacter ferrireducens]AOT68519.1 rRNA maturation RNase YbeY [Geosporobacter ferrireducens]MTI53982.1 rRNA maturation RNase YbeY [Geosporobacter ferrireducens]
MNILFDNRQGELDLSEQLEKFLGKVVSYTLEKEGINPNAEVSISFVNNTEIHHLNLTYRGVDKPTDVLSFPQYEGFDEVQQLDCLGDIVISIEKAQEQAVDYGHSFEREMAYLTVHSLYHLLGYDHDTEENTKKMREKEEEVLQALGIIRE